MWVLPIGGLPVQPCDDSCVPTCVAALCRLEPREVIEVMHCSVDRGQVGWCVEEATDFLAGRGVLRGVYNSCFGVDPGPKADGEALGLRAGGLFPIDWSKRMSAAMDLWSTGLCFGGEHCVVWFNGRYYDPRGFWLDELEWDIDIFVGCEIDGEVFLR